MRVTTSYILERTTEGRKHQVVKFLLEGNTKPEVAILLFSRKKRSVPKGLILYGNKKRRPMKNLKTKQ